MPLAFHEMRRDDRSQTALGGEPEELFVRLYNAAKQLPKMGRPFDEVIAAYERASNAAPNRAEALHAASRLCRENKRFEEGYEYARRGLEFRLQVTVFLFNNGFTTSGCSMSWLSMRTGPNGIRNASMRANAFFARAKCPRTCMTA